MATQAWLFIGSEQKTDIDMLYDSEAEANVVPRVIDNELANQLGEGDIVNDYYVVPARLLNDPDYLRYYSLCVQLPIYTWDSDVLFAPDPEV